VAQPAVEYLSRGMNREVKVISGLPGEAQELISRVERRNLTAGTVDMSGVQGMGSIAKHVSEALILNLES